MNTREGFILCCLGPYEFIYVTCVVSHVRLFLTIVRKHLDKAFLLCILTLTDLFNTAQLVAESIDVSHEPRICLMKGKMFLPER